ncbi:MAG TPA: hypothetical protein VG498_02365 [Terriglobales bacterium]|nr:hypothetical protein [Terriglobales bacterium]
MLFAMYWYTTVTVVAEIVNLIFSALPNEHVSPVLVRSLIYGSDLSFIVFVRTYIALRNYRNTML